MNSKKSSRLPKRVSCGVVLMASTMLQHDVANRLLSYWWGCAGVISGRVGQLPIILENNKLSQTKIDIFSGLWWQFSFAEDQTRKDVPVLGFGLREDQKTKPKPELALSQTT